MAELTTILRQQSKLGPVNVARAAMRDAADALDAAHKRIAELEAALEPFAAIHDIFLERAGNRPTSGDVMAWQDHRVGLRKLTVEMLATARASVPAPPSRSLLNKEEENG
jgi:hypothetical protein